MKSSLRDFFVCLLHIHIHLFPATTCPYACVCRSVDSPLALLPDTAALEDEVDGQNWQSTVPPQLLATLSPREVDRQAVIYGTI